MKKIYNITKIGYNRFFEYNCICYFFNATLNHFYYVGKELNYMYVKNKNVDKVDILQYILENYKHNICKNRGFFLILTFICSFFQLKMPE